jgi:hypothetical protein
VNSSGGFSPPFPLDPKQRPALYAEKSSHDLVRRRPKGADEGVRKARAMTTIFAERAAELRQRGEAMIREADNLSCQSWNERMCADGGPVDPSPTIDQAINGGFSWLELECSRCKAKREVDLAALRYVATTCVHDLARRLVCVKCKAVGKRRPRRCSN